jgi:integrase
MAAHRGVDRQVLSDVMGHARVGVTDRVYKHLYDRQSAEANFRRAMGGARERSLDA